uniref:Uncharacterized protein n=1 Tax=Anguilla anguilla TaxID=7936 RepID=A0A0E9UDY5_ANGAN
MRALAPREHVNLAPASPVYDIKE